MIEYSTKKMMITLDSGAAAALLRLAKRSRRRPMDEAALLIEGVLRERGELDITPVTATPIADRPA